MPSLSYQLHCTVCKGEFYTRKDWLTHLFSDNHQTVARLECAEWDAEIKNCCIVIFCDFPLTNVNLSLVLNHFSFEGNLVADMIWWRERPKVGILQFESRKKAKEIFSKFGAEVMLTDSMQLQLKRGRDFLELEWNVIFPFMDYSSLEENTQTLSSFPKTLLSTNFPTKDLPLLEHQLRQICKKVEIPDLEWTMAEKLCSRVKTIFASKYGDTEIKAVMIRHWYLKMKSNSENDLIIYVYKEDTANNSVHWINPTPEWAASILASDNENKLTGFSLVPEHESLHHGCTFKNALSGFTFTLLTSKYHIVEAQMCRLVQYLCLFDPRVRPILCLVHHWARVNNCKAGLSKESQWYWRTHMKLPDPVTLEWLVLNYLSKVRVIPSVREIQSRLHVPMYVPNTEIDVGFAEDVEFAKQWVAKDQECWEHIFQENPEFRYNEASSVVTLLRKMFYFYGRTVGNGKGNWIVNTRDGEAIQTEQFLNEEPNAGSNWKTNLTPEEVSIIRNTPTKLDFPAVFTEDRFYVVHPFVVQWRLSICNSSFIRCSEQMRITGARISRFQRTVNSSSDWDKALKRFGGLEGILKKPILRARRARGEKGPGGDFIR